MKGLRGAGWCESGEGYSRGWVRVRGTGVGLGVSMKGFAWFDR